VWSLPIKSCCSKFDVVGSEVVYVVAGLPYDITIWQAQWPVVMRNVIDACSEHNARLLFLYNVYTYSKVGGRSACPLAGGTTLGHQGHELVLTGAA
jgi:hypothetical protein